jgi:hypothetical protein
MTYQDDRLESRTWDSDGKFIVRFDIPWVAFSNFDMLEPGFRPGRVIFKG